MGLMAMTEIPLVGLSRRDFLSGRRRRGGGQPPRRPDSSSPSLSSQPPNWGRMLTRREILIAGSIMGAGIVAAAIFKPRTWFTQEDKENASAVDLGKQRLIEEIDKLPESQIKSLLITRIKPFYQQNSPGSVMYQGTEIKVSTTKVDLLTQNSNRVHGEFRLRGSTFQAEQLHPTQPATIKFPYVDLLLESEKSVFPPQNIAADGTPFINLQFQIDKPIYEGILPLIILTTPDIGTIDPSLRQLLKNYGRFALIKESCSHLLVDLWMEEVIKRMVKLGLSTTIEARRANGSTKNAEIITQATNVIDALGGRFVAALDLAGYLLAYKAIEGGELDNPNLMDTNLLNARPSMQALSLGTTPEEILRSSLSWALTAPTATLLVHLGDLKKIP